MYPYLNSKPIYLFWHLHLGLAIYVKYNMCKIELLLSCSWFALLTFFLILVIILSYTQILTPKICKCNSFPHSLYPIYQQIWPSLPPFTFSTHPPSHSPMPHALLLFILTGELATSFYFGDLNSYLSVRNSPPWVACLKSLHPIKHKIIYSSLYGHVHIIALSPSGSINSIHQLHLLSISTF